MSQVLSNEDCFKILRRGLAWKCCFAIISKTDLHLLLQFLLLRCHKHGQTSDHLCDFKLPEAFSCRFRLGLTNRTTLYRENCFFLTHIPWRLCATLIRQRACRRIRQRRSINKEFAIGLNTTTSLTSRDRNKHGTTRLTTFQIDLSSMIWYVRKCFESASK